MGYVGKVRKGTVVLPPEANLPEGTTVRVEPIPTETLATRLKDVIGVVREMPSDWAENHEHCIYGASKKWPLIFADTFYFLALLNQDDAAHNKARAVSEQLTDPIVTTAWVLAEVDDTLAPPNLRHIFFRLVQALRADSDTTIVPPTQTLFDEGLKLYAERSDHGWTLTNCISFVVMRQQDITEALTGDHHFEQAGFRALLR